MCFGGCLGLSLIQFRNILGCISKFWGLVMSKSVLRIWELVFSALIGDSSGARSPWRSAEILKKGARLEMPWTFLTADGKNVPFLTVDG